MIVEEMNILNVVRSASKLEDGRCKTAASRLNSTLASLGGKTTAVRMAQALAFIGNEVGNLPTFIAETLDVDQFVIGDNTEFDARLLKHLGDVAITHIPTTVKHQLKKAGWNEGDVLKGARICFYPELGTDAVREDFDLVNVFQWKGLLIVCDRAVTTVAKIGGQNKFEILTAATSMANTAANVGNSGVGSSIKQNPVRTLARILGYLRTIDKRPDACNVGVVPEGTVLDNAGSGSRYNVNGPQFYTGTWHRPHLRRAHYRIYNKGRKNEYKVKIDGIAVHGKPVTLRDQARETGTVRLYVVNP